MNLIKTIDYLSKNKRRISRGLYLLAALVEQLPDPDSPIASLTKMVTGRTLPGTIADQLPKPRKRRNAKRPANK